MKVFQASEDFAKEKANNVTEAFIVDQEVCCQKVADCFLKLDLFFLDVKDADLVEDQAQVKPDATKDIAEPTIDKALEALLTLCPFYGHPTDYDQVKVSLEERARVASGKRCEEKVAKEVKKAMEEAKEAIEEIAQLEIKLHTTIGKITSLEHLVELERSVAKEHGKMVKLVKEHATAQKAMAVV
ncbi:hypothetical protein COCNU_01G015620 [Cocos nucifera]|uniref:Uncharacterized protein n=1 Tax=Cocos nucifera TaxID=13894 RepID=A0A8K0MVG7_COCNU|nr:hypothetical protein COCNU_01G015620 [Cocos nucifera]